MTAFRAFRLVQTVFTSVASVALVALLAFSHAPGARGGPGDRLSASQSASLDRLIAAYPDALSHVDKLDLVWRDGTRMRVTDGDTGRSFEQMLRSPDILDMFALSYPPGRLSEKPGPNSDPGRFRNAAFFNKMYGDCRRGEVASDLVDVIWLPRKSGKRIKVTKRNGVADKLKAVVLELDALPEKFTRFLVPLAGTYNCRVIAGTNRLSAHAYGIAIDISVKHANYWRWSKQGAQAYRNTVPNEIVEIFEKHGFIWGGKWYHFDTMHFEYRPELLRVGGDP